MNAISRLMRPQRVAVIGASADITKTAGRPISYLLKHGFKGEIYPVNPKASVICGLTCYPDIASLPAVPDVGIVLLGAERAQRTLPTRCVPLSSLIRRQPARLSYRGPPQPAPELCDSRRCFKGPGLSVVGGANRGETSGKAA